MAASGTSWSDVRTSAVARRRRHWAAGLAAALLLLAGLVVAAEIGAQDGSVVVSRRSTWVDQGFTPDADGTDETISSYYCLSLPSTVTIQVLPEAGGAPVRTLDAGSSKQAFGTEACTSNSSNHQWSWDGKSDGGVVVAEGLYKVVVTATDANGAVGAAEFHTQVITSYPGVVESPVANSSVSGTVEVRFAAGVGRDVNQLYGSGPSWSQTVSTVDGEVYLTLRDHWAGFSSSIGGVLAGWYWSG